MDQKIRDILSRPFASELLKQRKGPSGKTFSYIEIQHYIDRLNEAFQGAWSWEVVRRDVLDDQVVVEGRLIACGVSKAGIGGSSVTRRRDDGAIVSLGDDVKKAEAEAIKRASRLMGVGGHLHLSEDDDAVPQLVPVPVRHPAAPTSRATVPDTARITTKQLNALRAIAREQGYGDTEFRSLCVERHGAQPEYLSRAAASQLIDSLGRSHSRPAAAGA